MSAALPSSAIFWTKPSDTTESTSRACSIQADIGVIGRWAEREAELLKIRKYRDNWDGFGADAPDPELVDVAISFLRELRARNEMTPPGRVALSPDGLVAIEWQKGDSFLRAEVQNLREVEWMSVVPGEQTRFITESLLDAQIGQTWEQAWDTSPSIAVGGAVSGFRT
jgi:hypothetical protein